MNIVLFDGICNLCNSSVSFLIKFDTQNNLHFSAQQTNAGKQLLNKYQIKDDCKSIIFIKEDLVFYKSDAIIEIAKLIKGWPRLLRFGGILPKVFRDFIYDIIAVNRYKIFGKRNVCSVPSQQNIDKFIV